MYINKITKRKITAKRPVIARINIYALVVVASVCEEI
jgi:hypothetical protein